MRPPEGGATLFYTMLPPVRLHLGTEGGGERAGAGVAHGARSLGGGGPRLVDPLDELLHLLRIKVRLHAKVWT